MEGHTHRRGDSPSGKHPASPELLSHRTEGAISFLLFFSYFPLDIFGINDILFLIRICVTLGFPLITFYTLFIIIALSRYTQRTLTKVIGISIQSIYIILFYFHIYLNKKLIHDSYPSYLSIDGICLDCI